MTATTFKERYAYHTSSFRYKKDSNKTELSKHIWKLKENNIECVLYNFHTQRKQKDVVFRGWVLNPRPLNY
jgi:hypothetical protein